MAEEDVSFCMRNTEFSGTFRNQVHLVSKVDCKTNEDEESELSLDKIANNLIKYNFILTALEFHAELVESGRELPRLRDFFSNPGNFEKNLHIEDNSPVLPRTSSIQTFDSLDFARYSDDGERQIDDRVAVLEFELRKAKDTIKALRANLTVVTESEPSVSSGSLHISTPDPIKPHEKRALNFLINEYLLHHNYKLSSITFSDENDDQDFEDWDDVGLNISKPPDVLQLYRNYCHFNQTSDVCDTATQTEAETINLESLLEYKDKYHSQETELNNLRGIVLSLSQDKEELVKVSEERDNMDITIKNLNRELNALKSMDSKSTDTRNSVENHDETLSIVSVPNENQDFVMVNCFSHWDNSDLNTVSKCSDSTTNSNATSQTQSISMLSPSVISSTDKQPQNVTSSRNLSPEFLTTLLSVCQSQKISQSNRLVNEVSEITNSKETVVTMLARCLPHIVPNILLAKREELIPLILCTIALHSDAKERDKLLNILFNLIKRPDEDQRHMILTGLVAIAQHLESERIEAELLPQCWEQITHRYSERRLLVAESCGVLAPYVPSGIRSSLLMSMLQQMIQEDKEEMVRETAVRNLALLLVYVDDSDKFAKALQLLHFSFDDHHSSVVETSISILLPSIAAWALETDKLESQLFPSFMFSLETELQKLNQKNSVSLVSGPTEEQRSILLIQATYSLLHFLLISVLKSGPFENSSSAELGGDRLPSAPSVLLDLVVIFGQKEHLFQLVEAYDKYISEEWFKPWEKYDWVVNVWLPWLLNMLKLVRPQSQSLVHCTTEMVRAFCRLFGYRFTKNVVKPFFQKHFVISEEGSYSNSISEESTFVQFNDSSLSVYIGGVLTSFCEEEDQKELQKFLQTILLMVSSYNIPVASLKAGFVELSCDKLYHDMLLSVLWDGVVHTAPSVRITSGRLFETLVGVVSESLLRMKVTPALVTLASDPEIAVRVSTVPAFGAIMEISSQKDLLEKVHLQFQTFLDDPVYWDQYLLHVEVIKTFAKLGPNAEPKFRDEFILPRLAALAAQNNNATSDKKKTEVALALLEAYVAISCCFISDQLIGEAFLPGLRCLRRDLLSVAPEHEDVVNSTILEFEAKLQTIRSMELNRPALIDSRAAMMEDVRNRVTRIFANRPTAPKPNIPNLFRRK